VSVVRRGRHRLLAVLGLSLAGAAVCAGSAGAYNWPVKPFDKPHPIRGTFGDPRFHLDAEGQLSAFHFGVDIVARDGAPVYAVEPGVVVRRHADSVTVGRDSGRRYGYWHIRPVVKSGTYVRLHQLLGHVIAGWGHVHFAESINGRYRNPLRKGALTPFVDHTIPIIASVQLLTGYGGGGVDPNRVIGPIGVIAGGYDLPPLLPPAPWDVARLAPATVSWKVVSSAGVTVASSVAASFNPGLPANSLYNSIYATGTYQNKPHRPGQYIFWAVHELDTAAFPDGTYTIEVQAADTRGNVGTGALQFTTANGVAPVPRRFR
jgi:murein DD-endopeptidase MepM/ murein hydrolase activator NlpD